IEPLVTGEDFGIQEFINDTGLTTDQLLGDAPIEKAEVKYMYELGNRLSSLSWCSPYPYKCTSSISCTWR
ncbi:hypothetical protein, partial [Klebsiella pneumoniae]|uniref:hypothetical protein n=1 Tax=Klebsiella pneumoniae TaxID=573 RepID=UPI00200D68E9